MLSIRASAALVKLAYLRAVVVREQILSPIELSLPASLIWSSFREPDVLVVVLSLEIRRVAIEKRLRSVILVYELLEVLVFDDHLLESRTGVVY